VYSEPKLWMKPPTPEEVFASFQDRGVYDGSVQDIVRPLFSDVVCPDGDDTLTVFGYLLTGMYPAFKTHNGESKVSFPYASEIGVCNEVTKRASQMATRLFAGPIARWGNEDILLQDITQPLPPSCFWECASVCLLNFQHFSTNRIKRRCVMRKPRKVDVEESSA
jgi:hypothetical protein